jgi:hypothetical protein
MSIDRRKLFASQLKELFGPALRSAGFKGSGVHFRRINGEVINAIWIQGSRDGTKCAVNLGLHLTFLPINWKDKLPDVAHIKATDCEFRDRLTPPGVEDYWWEYGTVVNQPPQSAAHLYATYFEFGEPRFRSYDTVEAIADMFTLDQLRAGNLNGGFGGFTVPRAALSMARIRAHLGQTQRAADFARIGLEKLGNASGLKAELERLAQVA